MAVEQLRPILVFGEAWASFAASAHLARKLALLALVRLVPVLGQIAFYGYALGWAREAAWRMGDPLSDRLLGAGDEGFWMRGVRGLAVGAVYGICSALVVVLVLSSMAALAWFGVEGRALLAWSLVAALAGIAALVAIWSLKMVGLLRMAIYDRLGAAFQAGVACRMLLHGPVSFRPVALAALAGFGLRCLAGLAVVAALVPGLVGVGVSGTMAGVLYGLIGEAPRVSDALCAFVWSSCVLLVFNAGCSYLLSVVSLVVRLLVLRSAGVWTSCFDVAAWHGPSDPLPLGAGRPERADNVGDGRSGAGSVLPGPRAVRSHAAVGFPAACVLAAVGLAACASVAVLGIFRLAFGDSLDAAQIKDAADLAFAEFTLFLIVGI